jgi:Gpi18-like mannosyltransferase
MIPNKSGDYKSFLRPWYEFIQNNGGWSALQYNFADYTPAYLYWLVIAATVLAGLPKLLSIKLFALTIDFLGAFCSYKIVQLNPKLSIHPRLGFWFVLFAPTVMVNSSLWGQCDIIYTTALLAFIYCLCIERYPLSYIFYGLAFSFKLQSIFLSPLLAISLFQKKKNPLALVFIPLTYAVVMTPAWLLGRPFKDLLLIYTNQASQYKRLTANAPNLYQWIPNDWFTITVPIGIIFTASLVLLLLILTYRSPIKLGAEQWVTLALLFSLVIPFFLPKMHDRYFFLADVLSIIFVLYQPKFYLLPIILQVASLISYANGDLTFLLKYCSIGVAWVVFSILKHSWESIFNAPQTAISPQLNINNLN